MFQTTQFLVSASQANEAIKRTLAEVESLVETSEYDYFYLDESDSPFAVSAKDPLFWKRLRHALRETTREIVMHKRSKNNIWNAYRYSQLQMGLFAPGNHFINLEDWGPFSRDVKEEVKARPQAWWLVSVKLHS